MRALAVGFAVLLTACTRIILLEGDSGLRPRDASVDAVIVDGSTDVGRDGGPDTGVMLPTGKCSESSQVDLLFIVDNSNSMTEEQAQLAAQLPSFVETLRNPPDSDGDGEADFPPIDDLHVGVVTSDMGTGGFLVPTCSEPNFGDDGVLRTTGNTAIMGCSATYPPFLNYTAGDDPAAFAAEVGCVAVAGTGGCGFEQQLEAALKAVTPSTSDITFAMGTTGHADGANAGFLRPASMLGVILVTDEEDCSALDPELFDPSTAVYTGDLNLRCFSYPGAVHPIDRYIDGFRALRSDRPDLFTFVAIAGVPADLAPAAVTDPDEMDAILADPRMAEEIDPEMPTRLRPSCDEPGIGLAFPPRRLVGVARAFPGQSVVASICQRDWTVPVQTISDTVGRRACTSYLR